MPANTHCPLCREAAPALYHQDKQRCYFRCHACALVFADRTKLLSSQAEYNQYLLHNNDLQDDGYRQFLSRLSEPLLTRLTSAGTSTGHSGLDFGCGPGPLLAKMLTEAGQHMQIWDPYFADNPAALQQQYDFICCSEAIEHFVNPQYEWQLWLRLLRPAGLLAIMTKRYTDLTAFSHWHYKNDPTHVSFFHQETFRWLAAQYKMSVDFVTNDVVILQKTG
ncbi:class I SAM-dependent methyltransferase [Arsukibacterium indicum]|uniref:Class I SAM-dependent methyltransferase n=1 Tax=Arsukibacterium indicum TaxID=2848612 RepID=A0ABS6MNJ4_9GAMM|nr:class I SAM-dependent methyltransferase [Arsukibacterium indicum]MBV2130389.1 class I SAM-dependent methyltransferase [Arsukibacterium indicum]